MKKLLVTVIGAAVAFGATAAIGPGEDFEALNRGEITIAQLGSYWSEGDDATKTNQYEIVDSSGEAYAGGTYPFDGTVTNALQVKTVFGKPLTFNVNSAKTGEPMGSEFYFDSAVKFTVCEDAPDATYNDAKIVMWLQETEDGSATNLFVRAGYLSVVAGVVTATPSNYLCTTTIPGDFADKYHRVTIKALPDITNGHNVPGFAIWIDGTANNPKIATSSAEKWDSSFTYSLTEAAHYLDASRYGALFPSLVQGSNEVMAKTTISGASFDGTGWVEELKFAATAPFAAAEDYVEPKGSYTIGEQAGVEFKTIEQLAAAINGYSGAANTVNVQFAKGFEVDTPIEFNNANVTNLVIDFNGCVITNTSSAYMITNNAQKLTFVDATGKGGIWCTSAAETAGAVYQNASGTTAINGGNFWGQLEKVGRGSFFVISGGSFQQNLNSTWLVAGKALQLNVETGLYDVVDATYTIKFVYGEGLATTATVENVAYNATPVAPAGSTDNITGKTFTGWSPTIVAATADATYVAQYTVITYTLTVAGGDHMTVEVVTNDAPAGAAGSYVVPYGSSATVTYTAAQDYKITVNTSTNIASIVDNVSVAAATVVPCEYYTAVTLNKATTSIETNMTETLEATFTPAAPAADDSYIWESSAPAIATVNQNGVVTAIAAGEATITVTATHDPLVTASCKVTVTATAPTPPTPTIPAGGEVECDDADAASDAADAINKAKETYITVPTGVGEGDKATYYQRVEAVADGKTVKVDFTTAGAAAAQTSADAAANVAKLDEAVVSAAANVGGGTATLSSTEPGFYYSIVSGTSPTSVTSEGARVLGTGGSLNLTVPNKGAQGFYRIKVSARAAD